MVDGTPLPMRLTLGALAELEHAFAVDSLPALGERFAGGRLSARDVTRILAAGLRGAGSSVSEDQVAGLAFDGGLNGAIRAAIDLLDATFGEPAGNAAAEGATPAAPSAAAGGLNPPAAPVAFPWREVMAFGLGHLGWAPEAFWAATPHEIGAALRAFQPAQAVTAPGRDAFHALMAAHPDA